MDANSIVGTPREREVWLAPDWSTYESISKKQPSGYTRVKVRDTTYADGRVVTVVLNERGTPVASDGQAATTDNPARTLEQTTDPDQQRIWQQQQSGAQRGDQEGDTRGPQDKPQREVYRGGKWVIEPNPVYQPGANVPARTPEQQRVDAATANKADEDERERAYHRALGHGNLTHAEYEAKLDKDAADARAAETQARADRNQERITAAQEAQNQIARDRLQLDKDKQNLPDVKPETIKVNGVDYTKITKTTKDGKTEVTYLGPDSKPIARLPSEGEATAGGPPLPSFTYDTIEQTLTDYWNTLNADKSLSPEIRNKRFSEAYQVAQLATQNHATAQRERESQRNTEYNVATQRLSGMQESTKNALDFVSKLNGYLPEGSPLGGQAFAALLGLNMLQTAASGLDTVARNALPTITPATLNDPKAVTQARQQIQTAVTQASTPPQTPPVATPPVAAASAPAVSPRPVAPTSAPAPAPTTPAPAVGQNPDAGQALGPTGNSGPIAPVQATGQNPDAGQGLGPTGASGPLPTPSVNPDGSPDYGAPGMRVLPQPTPPLPMNPAITAPYQDEQPVDVPVNADPTQGPVGQAVPDFAVLASARPTAPVQAGRVPDFSNAPALLHSQAASKPPWMMTEDEINQYKAAGVPDSVIWGVPGRAA